MPARVVVVHDDADFVERTVSALQAAGYDVAAFTDTMVALSSLEAAERIELLITRARFSPGQPNGVALARMAKRRRPSIKVLFVAHRDLQEHTAGVGEFVPAPIATDELMAMIARMLV